MVFSVEPASANGVNAGRHLKKNYTLVDWPYPSSYGYMDARAVLLGVNIYNAL